MPGLRRRSAIPRRAKYLYWLFFAPGCIEPAIMQIFTKIQIPARTAGWGDATQVFDVLDKALESGPGSSATSSPPPTS